MTLIVRDNGIGIPSTLDVHTTASLGLRLVVALTDQLDGTAHLDRQDGTTWTVRFAARVPTRRESAKSSST